MLKLFPDNGGLTYEEWLAARRYRVLRDVRKGRGSVSSVVASGLDLSAARGLADRMAAEYQAEHPGVSSWVADLFLIEMETPKWEVSR